MTALQSATLNAVRYFADVPTQTPADWCCENLRFDEAGNRGPFSVAGHEYMVEPINDFANKRITDEVLVFGSQSRKTGVLMGGNAWASQNDPCNTLWMMPNSNLAQRFTRKRWIPMLKASIGTRDSLPRGAQRHDLKSLEQRVGAAAFTFIGSNSPANASSDPCRRTMIDEADKCAEESKGEANSLDLVDQRTKAQPNPQRWKTSTPTIVEGMIWQYALKGDMRRFFVVCPLCGNNHPSSRRIVLAWSKPFTVLPTEGAAFVAWDKEAKRADGWDMDRVYRSARFQCPHCGGHILDGHKTAMNRSGEWRATKTASSGFVSRHLPSLYACAPETAVGALAVKFLNAKKSLLGLQGFINGDLAEPYQSQDRQRERVELVSSKVEVGAQWHLQLTVDCQAKSPNFWYCVRAFDKNKESNGIEAKSCDTWDDLRAVQNKHKILDACVCIDSGFGAKSDAEVYRQCARYGELEDRRDKLPVHMGWMPSKGMPGYKRWKNDEGLSVPFYLRPIDPYVGTTDAGQVEMSLFEFASDFIKDVLEDLRRGQGGHRWSVKQEVATDEYWRHMDSNIKMPEFNRMTGMTKHVWKKRSSTWPDHLLDCEVLQIALAAFFEIFELKEK